MSAPASPTAVASDKAGPSFHFEEIQLVPVTRAAGDAGDAAADSPDANGADTDVFHVVISTETPCEGWVGSEILSHTRGAVDMSLAKNGLSVYLEHGGYPYRPTPDPEMHIGVVENIALNGAKLEGDLRFSRHETAQRVKRDVMDRTLRFTSVRARPLKRKVVRATDPSEVDQVTYTRWRPEEMSIVGIPADPNAAVARSGGAEMYPVETEFESAAPVQPAQEEPKMSDPVTPTPQPTAAAAPTAEPAAPVVVTRSAAPPADVITLCESHGISMTRAKEFISAGMDLSEVKSKILDEKSSRGSARQPAAERVAADLSGVPLKERMRYSFARAIDMAIRVKEGAGKFEGVEAELHQELASQARAAGIPHRGGLSMPMTLVTAEETAERQWALTRAMGVNQSGGGAELVFDVPRDPMEILSNKMLTRRFGANFLTGLVGDVPLPVQTGDPTAYLIAENPASGVTQSQLAFVTRSLKAKEAVAQVVLPRRLLSVANFSVENMVRNRLFSKHALLWDRLGMFGTGASGEPQGVWFTSGVGSVAMGGAITFAKVVDLESAVTAANVESPNMAYILTPGAVGRAKQTPVLPSTASGFIFTGKGTDGEMNGYRAGGTNQVPTTINGTTAITGGSEHGIIFGDWSCLTYGSWGAFEFMVDSASAAVAGKGQVIVTTNELADCVLDRPEAFAIGTGLTVA